MYNKIRFSKMIYYTTLLWWFKVFYSRIWASHAGWAVPQSSDWSFLIRYSYSRFSPNDPTGLSLVCYVILCPSQWLPWRSLQVCFSVQSSNELLYRLDCTHPSTSGWSILRPQWHLGASSSGEQARTTYSVPVFIKDYSKSSRQLMGYYSQCTDFIASSE